MEKDINIQETAAEYQVSFKRLNDTNKTCGIGHVTIKYLEQISCNFVLKRNKLVQFDKELK